MPPFGSFPSESTDLMGDITGRPVVCSGLSVEISSLMKDDILNLKALVTGVKSVNKKCLLALKEAVKISGIMCEEESEISISKTCELLSKAQLLMKEIEELLDGCTSSGPANRRRSTMIQQESQARIEEDGETLIVEGFRFESATSREDLRKLSSQAGARGRQNNT